MPRIPIYQQQLTPNPTGTNPSFRSDPVAQGLSRLGQGVANLGEAKAREQYRDQVLQEREAEKARAENERKQEIEARIKAAVRNAQFDSGIRRYLLDAQTQTTPGADKFTDNFYSEFDKSAAAYEEAAGSETEKNLVRAHIASAREVFGSSAMTFEANERARNYGRQIDDGVETSAKTVLQNPEDFERNMGMWASTIKALPVAPEARDAMLDQARGKLANNAVMGMIEKNPMTDITQTSAWRALTDTEQQKAKNLITARRSDLEGKRTAEAIIGAAQQAVSGMILGDGSNIDIPAAKEAAAKAARARGVELTNERRLQLDSHVERVVADRERDFKRGRDAMMGAVFSDLDANGGDYQAVVAAHPWLSSTDTETRTRVNEYAGNVATGKTRETDWQVFGALTDNPGLLKQTNLDSIKDRLNTREFQQLKKLQQDIVDPTHEQNMLDNKAIVTRLLTEAGYKEKSEKGDQFFSLLQTAINQELSITGKKKVPQERVKELAAELVREDITSKGFFWDSKQEGFAIEVPDDMRGKIGEALQAEGIEPNDYNILQAYRAKLRRDNGQ